MLSHIRKLEPAKEIIMVRGIAHICIRVADLEATRRFYCDALGLGKAFDFLRDGGLCGFYLSAGERNYLEFFRRNPEEAVSGSPIHHFCLKVDSIEETSARLKQAGFTVTDRILGADHSWQAWTTDPDGVKIELHEYTPESCQKTGRDCLLP